MGVGKHKDCENPPTVVYRQHHWALAIVGMRVLAGTWALVLSDRCLAKGGCVPSLDFPTTRRFTRFRTITKILLLLIETVYLLPLIYLYKYLIATDATEYAKRVTAELRRSNGMVPSLSLLIFALWPGVELILQLVLSFRGLDGCYPTSEGENEKEEAKFIEWVYSAARRRVNGRAGEFDVEGYGKGYVLAHRTRLCAVCHAVGIDTEEEGWVLAARARLCPLCRARGGTEVKKNAEAP